MPLVENQTLPKPWPYPMPAGVSGDTNGDSTIAHMATHERSQGRVLTHTLAGIAHGPMIVAAIPQLMNAWEAKVIDTFKQIQTRLEATPHLLRLGRLFSETLLIEVGGDEFYLSFEKGRIVSVVEGPSRKTPWRFALRTDAEALNKFWQARPEPGFHDIFGLVKIGRGRIDGDILCLVKNLRFVKEVLTLARAKEELAA
ncbi:hypothetical protein [Ruegeria marina]|uniref:SCP-2 sterol transfer family protein n=1 Tax=Ruegeria marina TaxID=639004 RepID=A0A1G6Y688_9RHOB|nr:hypothetical protein SAMN04488239_11143 [Ruegeria marina]